MLWGPYSECPAILCQQLWQESNQQGSVAEGARTRSMIQRGIQERVRVRPQKCVITFLNLFKLKGASVLYQLETQGGSPSRVCRELRGDQVISQTKQIPLDWKEYHNYISVLLGDSGHVRPHGQSRWIQIQLNQHNQSTTAMLLLFVSGLLV